MTGLGATAIAAAMLNALWQGSLLTIVAFCVLRFVSMDARSRYGVLLLVLCATASIPFLNLSVDARATKAPASIASESSTVPDSSAIASRIDEPTSEPARSATPLVPTLRLDSGRWMPLALFVWAVLTGSSLLRLFASARSLDRMESRSKLAPAWIANRLETWCASLNLRPIELRLSRDARVPLSIGLGRRLILLPEHIADEWSAEELDAVLLHESAHLHRRDDWTNLGSRLALALFPFHPALVALERRLREEREVASDMLALSWFGSGHEYGAALLGLAGRFARQSARPPVLSHAMASGSKLSYRIRRIMKGDPVMKPLTARLVLPTTALALALAVALVSCSKNPRVEVVSSRPHGPSAATTSPEHRSVSADEERAHSADSPHLARAHQEHRDAVHSLREAQAETRNALRQARESRQRVLRELGDDSRRLARAQREELRELHREKRRAMRELRGDLQRKLRQELRASRDKLHDSLQRMRTELREQLRRELEHDKREELLQSHEEELQREAERMEEALARELERMEQELELELELEHLERDLSSTMKELESIGELGAEIAHDVVPAVVEALPLEEIAELSVTGVLAVVEEAVEGVHGVLAELDEEAEQEEDDKNDDDGASRRRDPSRPELRYL